MGSNSTETAKNLSFVLQGIHKVSFEDRPIPELNGPYDVLIQVNYTGICGSDVHYWDHGSIGPFVLTSPMVLGHESSGTVVSVGDAVKTLQPGDGVAMEPGVPCRRCLRCKEGKYNLCPEMVFAATPPHDGTLAKYYVLPEDFCYKLPKGMTLAEGALIEPLAVAVHIVKQAVVRLGDSVIVFGVGPVGLLCCAVARQFGAAKVVAVDIQPSRLKFAEEFAATSSYESLRVSAEENARNLIKQNDLGWGADVAIDASGAEPSVRTAIHVLRTGGVYVQGGMGKDELTFPIMAACTKELRIMGSFRYGAYDYKMAVELVASGKIEVKKLISRQVKFEEAEQAFIDVKAGKAIKVLIGGSGKGVDAAPVPEGQEVATGENGGGSHADGPRSVHNGSPTKAKVEQSGAEPSEAAAEKEVGPLHEQPASGASESKPTAAEKEPSDEYSETVKNQNGALDEQPAQLTSESEPKTAEHEPAPTADGKPIAKTPEPAAKVESAFPTEKSPPAAKEESVLSTGESLPAAAEETVPLISESQLAAQEAGPGPEVQENSSSIAKDGLAAAAVAAPPGQ